MDTILIAGAGQVGSTIAHLLARTTKYEVILADCQLLQINPNLRHLPHLQFQQIDLTNAADVTRLIENKKIQAVLSALPYFCNQQIAQIAYDNQIHYFDLTEDIAVTAFVQQLAQNSQKASVPQCGLAPGFVNIIANDLMRDVNELETVKIRCGALPMHVSNELKYAFTWSVDGLLNEYNKPCPSIENGEIVMQQPLENVENVQIDGLSYEAFNTSGGLGSLPQTYVGRVESLTYKSIRYPGHRDRIRFLMNDLKLRYDMDTLKSILLNAIPFTIDDVVIIYISVIGKMKDRLVRRTFVNKYYGEKINNIDYTALQITTAATACAVLHIVLSHPEKYAGYIRQEQFTLNEVLQGPFGTYLKVKHEKKHS